MTRLEHVLPAVSEFLHLVDTSCLSMASRKIRAVTGHIMQLQESFRKLELHGMDSADCAIDLRLSNFLFNSTHDLSEKSAVLARFALAEDLAVYNTEEASLIFDFLVHRMKRLTTLVLCNVTNPVQVCVFNAIACTLVSLKLGFNQNLEISNLPFLNLPKLKTLELTGFEPCAANLVWLLSLLRTTAALRWLRVNCERTLYDLSSVQSPQSWNKEALFYLELVQPESVLSEIEKVNFKQFSTLVLGNAPALPHMHTVTLNRSPPPSLWNALALSKNLMHVVLTGIDPKSVSSLNDLKSILKNNLASLQILVLKFSGKCPFHFDALLQLILNCGNPPLERFELEVEIDHASGLMETPVHSIKAAATLRCRYRNNMFFNRSKFGIAMAFHRLVCSDSDSPRNVASPMELFCEEMIGGMYETEERNSAQIEADMINEWNKVGQIQRSIYVEIFDDYIEKELHSDDCPPIDKEDDSGSRGYCDVAATIANLRE